MVAAPGKEGNGAKGPMHTEASKGATPMVWAPRMGRSKAYERWRHVILDSLADLGFNSFEDAMDFSPPSQDALSQLAGDGLDTRAKRLDRASCARHALAASFLRLVGAAMTQLHYGLLRLTWRCHMTSG